MTAVDPARLRARARRLSKEDILLILDRAIEHVPKDQLAGLLGWQLKPEEVAPDQGSLLETIEEFVRAS
ncbi:MAG: hypothetical protein AB7S38_15160 [Vulcanimicrobiota bacterium]